MIMQAKRTQYKIIQHSRVRVYPKVRTIKTDIKLQRKLWQVL